MDCSCKNCQNACRRKPGWFKPGEAEKVASFLGLSLEELFKKSLAIDYWVETNTFILAPATKSETGGLPGNVYSYFGKGECVFFKNGLCSIHDVKPFECRELFHDPIIVSQQKHEEVSIVWRTEENQKQIEQLYGDKPEIQRMNSKELTQMFFKFEEEYGKSA